MDFEKRLQKAVERGQQARDVRGRERADAAISEDELKTLHSKCRLDLSEHIETCFKKLTDQFPGFRFQSVVDESGWGAIINRDDFFANAMKSNQNLYSRFEMLIRPFSPARIVELSAKGTIHNKEVLGRSHYQFLAQVDLDSFSELIDLWVLEYAEKYAAS